MRSLLLTVFAILVTTIANVDALKCYFCIEVGDDACSKSRLEGNQAKYSRDCGYLFNRCYRVESELLGIKAVSTTCTTESSCKSLKDSCDNHDACNDATCCDTDNCNAGSAVYFSMLLMAVCCVVGLVLK